MTKRYDLANKEIELKLVEHFKNTFEDDIKFKIALSRWIEENNDCSITLEVYDDDFWAYSFPVGSGYTNMESKEKIEEVIELLRNSVDIKKSLGVLKKIVYVSISTRDADKILEELENGGENSTDKIVSDELKEIGFDEQVRKGDYIYAVRDRKHYEFHVDDLGHTIMINYRDILSPDWKLLKRVETGKDIEIRYL